MQTLTKNRTSFPHRTFDYKPVLAWFCLLVLGWTTLLLYAGGFTTSIRAGMAFLDWPLSNGSINPDGWLTESDKMAEHSHRLLATGTGILCIVLAIWLNLRESRSWLRTLGWASLGMVITQGLLGGARVLFDQQNIGGDDNRIAQTFAVLHGLTGQLTFCLLIAIAIASSRSWISRNAGLDGPVSGRIRMWGLLALGAVVLQLLFGAMMRHAHAGLAIPTFPLSSEGSLLPAAWDYRVGIHFAHRAWAVVVTVVLLVFLSLIWGSPRTRRALGIPSALLVLLLSVQIYLGALVIWTVRNSNAATIHMLNGAFVLAATFSLTFLCHRFQFGDTRTVGNSPKEDRASRTDLPASSAAN
ncbi:MAG: COX15/CtaA family protein [Opitutaceae bacterium]